jgi:sucrose phosphorylase
MNSVKNLLHKIYGAETGNLALERLAPMMEKYPAAAKAKKEFFSQEDVVLITYGDTLNKAGQAPIATLHEFAAKYLQDAISTIHFLPFFPYSSDDGFSVMDFFAQSSVRILGGRKSHQQGFRTHVRLCGQSFLIPEPVVCRLPGG